MYGPASSASSNTTVRRAGAGRGGLQKPSIYGDAEPIPAARQSTGHNRRSAVPLELGAVLNTVCVRCGLTGHLSSDCYFRKGDKSYQLVTDMDEVEAAAAATVQYMPLFSSSSFSPSRRTAHPVGRDRGAALAIHLPLPPALAPPHHRPSPSAWFPHGCRDKVQGLGTCNESLVASCRTSAPSVGDSGDSSSVRYPPLPVPDQGGSRGGVGRGRGAVVPAWMTQIETAPSHTEDTRFGGRSDAHTTDHHHHYDKEDKKQRKSHKHEEHMHRHKHMHKHKEHKHKEKRHKERKHNDRKEKKSKKDHSEEEKDRKKSSKHKSRRRSPGDADDAEKDDDHKHKRSRERSSSSGSESSY